MKIVIDNASSSGAYGYRGGGRYTRELYKALSELDDGNEYQLANASEALDADLIHYPFFDFFFLTLPSGHTKPFVVTIHDTIPLVYPDKYSPGLKGRIKLLVQKHRLRKTAGVLTDSKVSKRDIHTHLDIQASKIRAVYLAASDVFSPLNNADTADVLSSYGIDKPYLLYVGDINYNKNIPRLLEAFAQTPSEHQLVMVSKAMKQDIPESRLIQKTLMKFHLEERVQILMDVPALPQNDLLGLYSGADWYIQPSLYEGFGLPVLEAWACETPVLSSTGGSLNEVVGDAAIPFDPTSLDSLTDALQQAVSMNENERNAWIQRGIKRNAQFSWQKTAQETAAFYQRVI